MKCNQVPTIKAEPREVSQFLSVPTGGFLLHLPLYENHGKKTAFNLSPLTAAKCICLFSVCTNYATMTELAQFHVH